MSKPGHNSSDNRLKSLADRIERLMDERDGIQADIRDIYAEAKSAGYVPKVLRKAITRKRMDPDKRSEEDTILDLYEDALSPSMRRAVQMAKAGATSREIETETGIDHVTVTRSVSLNKFSETADAAPQGDSTPLAPQADEAPTSTVTPVPQGGEGTGTNTESCGERAGTRSPNRSRVETAHCDGDARNQANPAVVGPPARFDSGPHDTDDDLAIPPHLRGPSPANRRLA